MKITLNPLFSKENPSSETCPLNCQGECQVKKKAPDLWKNSDSPCPLSLHQAETCAEVIYGDAEVIFNTSATGDGKSLAASLPALLDPKFRMIGLYPTIELETDQEMQIKRYFQHFNLDGKKQVDSIYGAELARRVAAAGQGKKGEKFRQLRLAIKRNHVILTNPDIFHLITHFRYWNPACDPGLLITPLVEFPHLYVADEFHIFGVHQEAAILNSMLLIRHSRHSQRPARFLFTSATPKPKFIQKLREAGFKIKEVSGNYTNQSTPGYRQILQPIKLEFVKLETDSLDWLTNQADSIRNILKEEQRPGRGLIILNSVALANKAVLELQKLLPDVIVKEVSGQIDSYERATTREDLKNHPKPILVVGTSAVDVGVDFDIHLLIFEASDSATLTQRLGRLGRHKGFSNYQAFVLIPGWMNWIWSGLRGKEFKENQPVDRNDFREEIIEKVFDSQTEFQEYRQYWGALQAQGILFSMSKENPKVMQQIKERMREDLRRIYGEQLDKKRGHWFALGKDETGTGQRVQEELLRFRGGSDLQAAVWDVSRSRFYLYDLLRILPYAEVEVIKRQEFLEGMKQYQPQRSEVEFDERYILVYLKHKERLEQKNLMELECDRLTDELKIGTLTLIDGLSIPCQPPELNQHLSKQELLTFFVRVDRKQLNSHWDISNTLHLSPTFGLYRIRDAEDEAYACAFNQDALLLEALKWKLKRCAKNKPYIY